MGDIGSVSAQGTDGTSFENRIAWYGNPGRYSAENLIYESKNMLEVIVNLVNLDSWSHEST